MAGEKNGESAKEKSDSDKLLAMFPPEIWQSIFHSVENNNDLLSIMRASPTFDKILKERKTTILFSSVFPVLGRVLHDKSEWLDVEVNFPDTGDPVASWAVRRRLAKRFRTILSLRLVSRTWKKVVDNFYYHESLTANMRGNDRGFSHPGPALLPWCNFFQESFHVDTREHRYKYCSIPEFMAHFNLTHGDRLVRSPFISGHVRLNIPEEAQEDEFSQFDQEVTQLLTTYGRHIPSCHFKFRDKFITTGTFTKLRDWLSFLPNLVCVDVDFETPFKAPPPALLSHQPTSEWTCTIKAPLPFVRALESTPPSAYSQLKSLVAARPIPNYKKLMYLNLLNVCPVILNPFLQANNHVTVLRLNHGEHEDSDMIFHHLSLRNLRRLEVTYPKNERSDFTKLERAKFNHRFSSLSVYYEQGAPPIWQMFAIWGSKWGSNVTHLKIYVAPLKAGSDDKEAKDRVIEQVHMMQKKYLPSVKRLQLYGVDG